MKTSDLVSNSSLGQMTPDDVLGLVQDRLASARTGLIHVQMHKQLLERAVEAERARCLRIVEECCVAFRNSARDDMAEAREKGMIDAEMFHGHRAWSADELCQIIEKAIGEEVGR